MSKIWNSCRLIYSDGAYLGFQSDETFELFRRYCNFVGDYPKFNVWCDIKTKIIFGLDLNWHNAGFVEPILMDTPNGFLNNPRSNLDYIIKKHLGGNQKAYFETFSKSSLIQNTEIMYHTNEHLNKIKGAKILVIGGGPTTNAVDWDSTQYDYTISCNFFFLNEKVKNTNMVYANLCDELDLKSPQFIDYVENSETIFGFEDCNPAKRSFHKVAEFANKYPNRTTHVHARYRSKEGATSRAVVTAAMIGAKEIHIVGMDGIKPDAKLGECSAHSFEKGKVNQGAIDYNLYRRHFVMLWDYLLNYLNKDGKIKFVNLGEGHPRNQSTDISQQEFPLEKELINVT